MSTTTLIVLVLLGLLISLRSREPEAVLAPVIIEEDISNTPISTTTEEDFVSTSTISTTTATSTD
ncbi:MAG: hypothetical protein ACYCY6_02260 [Minisyncoccota bacterium]